MVKSTRTRNAFASPAAAERGVTMVEFTFALVLFVLILGAFFDIGLALHNWMLLRSVTLESTRSIAVSFVTNPDCDSVASYLEQKATPRLRDALGADVKPGDLSWTVDWVNPGSSSSYAPTFPTLRLSGEFHVGCLFICHVLPKGFTLSATSETVIELEQPNGVPCKGFSIKS
jgi:hypothetical protein